MTTDNPYSSLIARQNAFFRTHGTKSYTFRADALRKLGDVIRAHEGEIVQALKTDLNKSEFEAYSTEIGVVLKEIRHTLQHLRAWMRPTKVRTPLTHFGSKSTIHHDPYGVVLIIAPWNFPFQLAIAPLIGAIAAGNCAIVKPSELTPRTSEIVAKLLRGIYLDEYVAVVEGGVEASQGLLNEKVDYIFFTGGTAIGHIVMSSAAKHLTPVTLELGGKSPCIIHADATLPLAARRIAWGKFTNAGQTCIAPDYLYVHESVKDAFIAELKQAIATMYGANPLQSDTFTRIVSARHFERLEAYLHEGQVAIGGQFDREQLRIAPTVLTEITADDPVMQDEIFGPILPVLTYTDLDHIIDEINRRPKPLALYLFAESKQVQQRVLDHTSFGGGCINDTLYHFTSPHLPFGGVGSSGIGAYHGKSSFELFSHHKSVLKQTTWFDIPFRYPHIKNGLKRIKLFLK
ncbi:MAG: aldehyde dehydrogenase [Candidatus Cohnella colombiensis]|uniref:Aldehyde dehydrogenase n=1 Tax=Candidatus Cohnella colombiensis TaxID=3121368 RepID=A0AA95EZB4_9BACL|nr:MAG: aldehyde dehydrogenase [Cohnella sp.]